MNLKSFVNSTSLAKPPKTLYDGRVRKVFAFFILLLFIFSIKNPLPSTAQESPGCTATVSPLKGTAGETIFSISGSVFNLPPNATDIQLNIIDVVKNHVVLYVPITLNLESPDAGDFGPTDLQPFNLPGDYAAKIYYTKTIRGTISYLLCSSNPFSVDQSSTPMLSKCDPPGRDPKDQSRCLDPRCTPTGRYQCLLPAVEIADTPTPTPVPHDLPCSKWANLEGTPIPLQEVEKTKDKKCLAVATAVGEISTDPLKFVTSIMSILLGLAGGIAVVIIIVAGYRLMASQGNPEAVQAAREQITSAIVGLLFIIFSLVILEVIGVDILRIPGFEK